MLQSSIYSNVGLSANQPAFQLDFGVQPSNVDDNIVITPAVTVQVENHSGQVVVSSTASITVALTSAGGAVLGGTLVQDAVAGIATFDDLTVDLDGVYTLTATSASLTSAVSHVFSVGNVLAVAGLVTRGISFGGLEAIVLDGLAA